MPDQLVVVSTPRARVERPRGAGLHLNLLQQTQAGGAATGGGGAPAARAGARRQCGSYLPRAIPGLTHTQFDKSEPRHDNQFRDSSPRALRGGLLVLLGGCQACNSWLASFKPTAHPYVRDGCRRNDAVQPITKEQKIEVQMAVARACENDGNTEQAIQSYLDVIKKDSGHVEAYHRLAIMYDTKGDVAKSRYFLTAIQKAPKNADLVLRLRLQLLLAAELGRRRRQPPPRPGDQA